MSSTLLVKNAGVLVTMDDRRREIPGGGLYAEDGRIVAIGAPAELPATADEVLDLRDHVVVPGFVNAHHHMYQSLLRAVPAAQDAELFAWLQTLYPLMERLTPEMIAVSALTAMAELLLSGCTTTSDHLYVYPNGCTLDESIASARRIGMRFHAARGAMSVGRSRGGLPPDALVEDEGAILDDTRRVIERFHDDRRFAMVRIAVAPCSPFSVSRELMHDAARLAREYGVRMHTHLAENDADVAYSRTHFDMTPAEYARSLGWVGRDVWHAHCVKLDEAGIALFASTGTGVAHCPSSNMRLASGIAPVAAMMRAGVPVGLGVDGSASNDASDMRAEVRTALLLQRVGFGAGAMSARGALELATRGGAAVLGRDDVGQLAVGTAADLTAFDVRRVGFAGALGDPVAALALCDPGSAAYTVVNGSVLVREGRLTSIDLPATIARHNALAAELVRA